RDYNPAVPDVMAAVLAKMMAKDPAQRYQTPAELMHELTRIARTWNLAPEGLPLVAESSIVQRAEPPRESWPVGTLVGLGIFLAALVLIVQWPGLTSNPATSPANPPRGTGLEDRSPLRLAPEVPLPATVPMASNLPDDVVADSRALAEALRTGRSPIRLIPDTIYDCAAQSFTGPEFILETAGKSLKAPIVRFTVGATPALTIKAANRVVLRGVRVQLLLDGRTESAMDGAAAAILCEGASRVELDDVRARADRTPALRLLLLQVQPQARPTDLLLRQCLFDLGPTSAVARLQGRVNADVRHCAFAPHEAAFQLRPDPDNADATGELILRESSFLLDRGSAAVEASRGASFSISAGYCVFAAEPPASAAAIMPGMGTMDARPTVYRVVADNPTAVPSTFTGRASETNIYFRTEAFATSERAYSFEECARQFTPVPASDLAAVVREQSPWESPTPARFLAGDRPEQAFRLQLTDPKLYVAGPVGIVGARELCGPTGLRLYSDVVFPRPKPLPV
ncbi:MAG: hypothetical protein ACRCZF_13745, partial [Gemmataceae bacterium]